MKQFILDMFTAIDARAFHRLPEFFADDVVYERPGYPPIRGLADLTDFYEHRRRIRTGAHSIEEIVADTSAAVAIGEIDATLRDGARSCVRFADAYRFAAGRIIYRHTYFDVPAV
jgi:ketosteroid isomerase-like protein